MPTLPKRPGCCLLPLALAASSAAQVAALPRWTPLSEMPRYVAYPVWDAARDRVVAFGSYVQSVGDPVRAIEWNGRWQAHQLASGSTLGSLLGAVYDGARHEVLLVGQVGISSSALQNEVYQNGRFRSIPGVPLSRGVALVFDAARGEVLAFGGEGQGFSVVDHMWRWTGAGWTAVAQPAVRPSARKGAALVFDPLRGKVVLFGGSDGVNNPFGDTWTWDGQVWQAMAASGPVPRERAGFAFDLPSGTCLLHGGYVRDQEVAGSWQWGGAQWTQLSVPPAPGAGWLVETATRPLLLREGKLADNGSWQWTGAGFAPVAPPQNALARYESVLVSDAARSELVLFGGQPVAGGLWLWRDGWRHVGLSANGPSGRRNHAMAYDAVRQQVVLFGGRDADVAGQRLGDTWTWDGVGWTQQQPASAPSARISPGFVYDTARQQCLLFGGVGAQEFADTWTWDGSNWTQQQPATSPSGRHEPGFACDEARQRIVLLNGRIGGTPVLDTWEWDGASWTQRTPRVQPSGPIVYDRSIGRVLVVTSFGSIHGFDGNEWQPLPVYSPIGLRPQPMSLAWHDALGRVVMCTAAEGPMLWALTWGAAQVESFGTPCPGAASNDCDLLALGVPRIGNDRFDLDLRGRTGNTYGALVWGDGQGSLPLPGGCALLAGAPFGSSLVWLGAGGLGRVRLPVPANTTLLGVAFAAQGFALDGQGPLGGASTSAALRLQVGL